MGTQPHRADATKRVASANNPQNGVVIHPCNGGTGVVWGLDTSTGHLRWVNQYATKEFAGDHTHADQHTWPPDKQRSSINGMILKHDRCAGLFTCLPPAPTEGRGGFPTS